VFEMSFSPDIMLLKFIEVFSGGEQGIKFTTTTVFKGEEDLLRILEGVFQLDDVLIVH
jgi:hypothetical protein